MVSRENERPYIGGVKGPSRYVAGLARLEVGRADGRSFEDVEVKGWWGRCFRGGEVWSRLRLGGSEVDIRRFFS